MAALVIVAYSVNVRVEPMILLTANVRVHSDSYKEPVPPASTKAGAHRAACYRRGESQTGNA